MDDHERQETRPLISFQDRTSQTDEVTKYIHSLIVSGQLKPKEKLPSERELSQTLSVSRSSVREALQKLTMIRLIDIKAGRGSFVRSILPEDVLDVNVLSRLIQDDSLKELAEARCILEVQIASLAAERRTEDNLHALKRALIGPKVEELSAEELIKADLDFHLIIAKATNNSVLLKLFMTIFPLLGESRAKVQDIFDARQRIMKSHLAIYEAIEQQDGNKARDSMFKHLDELWHDTNR
jgi:GntR family transcriptional regulator, transcriptional repressor for pyruvate dehydrogenase complex